MVVLLQNHLMVAGRRPVAVPAVVLARALVEGLVVGRLRLLLIEEMTQGLLHQAASRRQERMDRRNMAFLRRRQGLADILVAVVAEAFRMFRITAATGFVRKFRLLKKRMKKVRTCGRWATLAVVGSTQSRPVSKRLPLSSVAVTLHLM